MSTGAPTFTPPDPRDPERLLRFLTEVAPSTEVQAPVERLSMLGLRVGSDRYAIHVSRVLEVARPAALTRVPAAPEHVRGLMNLRGRILPVLELSTRLGLPPATETPASRIVVAEQEGRRIGLWIDEALGVLRPVRATLAPPPAEVRSPLSQFVLATLPQDGGVTLVLDLDRLLLLPAKRSE
jgi:purine-binding chemotaxis protein CheW